MKPDHGIQGAEVRSGLITGAEAELFEAARRLLKRHLIHKREIPNGRDFLFSGPETELHGALKTLVEVEHKQNRLLRLDHVLVDEYFLLRIIGTEQNEETIRRYFDQDDKGKE